MKNHYTFIILFIGLSNLFGQTICDQFIVSVRQKTEQTNPKRSFSMTTQINGDTKINYTEADTLGRTHFLGSVGSLKVESFFADGKRYSKIQSEYIQDDEWTWQEVESEDYNTKKWFEIFKDISQNIDCQQIGEERMNTKTYQILAYTLQSKMPKRNGIDSFLMDINVKTWFSAKDNSVFKHVYTMTTEKSGQIIESSIEYDVPVNITLPKNAKYEAPPQATLVQNRATDAKKLEKAPPQSRESRDVPYIDSSQTKPLKIWADNFKIETQTLVENSQLQKSTVKDSSFIRQKDTAVIYTTVDQNPEYKDGLAALSKYVNKNMHYPEEARKEGIRGTVFVSFVVETDGCLSNIHIQKSVHNAVDEEAKRLVQAMSGTWKAGKLNGKEVRTSYTLPLRFDLGD